MTISLVKLQADEFSLEFAETDFDEIRAAILGLYGKILTNRKAAIYDEVEFGGESFTYYHEFDPCLISHSELGSNMLRRILSYFEAMH